MISLDKLRRGPMFVFEVRNGTLQELSSDPQLFKAIAYTMILNEHLVSAHDVLVASLERDSTDRAARHWLGWVQWARGQREEATRLIAQTGFATNAGASPEVAIALERMAAKDTLGATNIALNGVRAHALNPRTHAVLADLLLNQPRMRDQAGIEAFAARVLAPNDPAAWRRWSVVQVQNQRYEQAVKSLERYFVLAGPAGNGDFEAARLLAALRRIGPGGDIAQQALRHTTSLVH
jgi:tetratricopeptide (TPR) repeat protein